MINLLDLWNTMVIHEEIQDKLESICIQIEVNKPHYDKVSQLTGIPYYVIAAIHYRESTFSFNHHLHNGDPLTERTVHVPKGRPKMPDPPYTWEQSAIDALDDIAIENKNHVWSITNMLFQLEAYNGFGYRHVQIKPINSPYLWSGTNHYTVGKYASDGKFDPKLVDQQIGCAPIIKELMK